jgi:predicted Zn-dependent protease with MMP-like domain
MDIEEFEDVVAESIEGLPDTFFEKIENLEIEVEEWPDRETMRLAGVRQRAQLMGFYHGIPLTERTHGYNMVPPDKISIYRQPILLYCQATGEDLRETIRHVVQHEIAHYFGISDERLHEIGAY